MGEGKLLIILLFMLFSCNKKAGSDKTVVKYEAMQDSPLEIYNAEGVRKTPYANSVINNITDCHDYYTSFLDNVKFDDSNLSNSKNYTILKNCTDTLITDIVIELQFFSSVTDSVDDSFPVFPLLDDNAQMTLKFYKKEKIVIPFLRTGETIGFLSYLCKFIPYQKNIDLNEYWKQYDYGVSEIIISYAYKGKSFTKKLNELQYSNSGSYQYLYSKDIFFFTEP